MATPEEVRAFIEWRVLDRQQMNNKGKDMTHRIIEVTDWWLWVNDKDGIPFRAWIRGKYFYIKSHDRYTFSNGVRDFKWEKYRYLGKCLNKMAHRIVPIKIDGFSKQLSRKQYDKYL